jgi:hypothetical protein
VNARILIHDGGDHALKSIFEKSKLPTAYYSIVRAAMNVVHETKLDGGEHDMERYRARIIERILTQFEDFGPSDDIEYLLEKLKSVA